MSESAGIEAGGSTPSPKSPEQEASERWERERHLDVVGEILRQAGFPDRHMRVKTADLAGKSWLDSYHKLVAAICEHPGTYALIGPRGRGKTQLAERLGRGYVKRTEKRVLYAKARDFYYDLKETFDGKSNEKQVLRTYCMPELLVLDELQDISDNDWTKDTLTYLIDARYDRLKSTILIANLDHEQFVRFVGVSIYDRIRETGAVKECNWQSYRKV